MTRERLEQILGNDHDDEYLKFDRVTEKRSNRPDLHAFLLLDHLQPGTGDMVSAAEHDEFYLSINLDDLADVISEDQVVELVRCGVRLDSSGDGLAMFA